MVRKRHFFTKKLNIKTSTLLRPLKVDPESDPIILFHCNYKCNKMYKFTHHQGHTTRTCSLSRQWSVKWCCRNPYIYKLAGFLMAMCLPSMTATQLGKLHFLRKPSACCFHSSGLEGAVITSSTYSSHVA